MSRLTSNIYWNNKININYKNVKKQTHDTHVKCVCTEDKAMSPFREMNPL